MPSPTEPPEERPLLLELSTEVLRNGLVLVALLTCAGAILGGVTADGMVRIVGLIAAGVAGGVLVFAAMLMGWRGWQWLVYLAVIAANLGLLALAAG